MPHTFEIVPRAPYSFDLTASRFGRFASEIVDLLDGKQYRRLLTAGRQLALATVTDVGTVGKPRLAVELRSPSKAPLQREAFEALVRHILCTDLDLKPFYRLARSNDLLAPLVKRFRGLRLASSPTLFEALVGAVLSQQVNLTFAYSIKRELVERFGRKWRVGGRAYWAFPEPRRFAEQSMETLRAFRLSNAKAGTLVRLGEAFASSASSADLNSLSDEALVTRLTDLKGVGRWTAETALVRGLTRPDVFPAGDLAVVKYLAQSLLGKTEKVPEAEMRAFAERWRPYRGLALVYCYAEMGRRRSEG
jgi:DNA-3-methyladenine glycosylase II